ncbi:dodecin family protein [Desulfothermobacter acidiphilus]|uniref:dodecin family protein n=1 Tax=Desulfothermobacter acidiphilus TaxID=1938353 RepID=UPI003F8BA0DB
MHVKVAELVGESPHSWREAVQVAVSEASRTLGRVTGVELLNLTANVEEGVIKEYKANVKVAYVE